MSRRSLRTQVNVPDSTELLPNAAFGQLQLADPRGFGAQSAIEMPPRTV
jgi:hypothetical protein